jgi:hypothetical protein
MAVSKSTSAGRKSIRSRQVLRFPQAKGKRIDRVELSSSSEAHEIDIRFEDNTSLNFSIEAYVGFIPEFIDWTSGEYKPIKRWRPIYSKPSSV